MTGMTLARTRRILHAVGWRCSDLRGAFAGVARTKCDGRDISALFGGTRQVPPSVSVFLCMSVQLAVVRHQVARARRIQERRNSDASNGGSDVNDPAVQLLARKLAAHAVAAMAQAGVTYKLDVPPHDGFNKLINMTREWLENNADLATIPPDAGWETKRVPGAWPAIGR